jgi:hypothetical protein
VIAKADPHTRLREVTGLRDLLDATFGLVVAHLERDNGPHRERLGDAEKQSVRIQLADDRGASHHYTCVTDLNHLFHRASLP